MKVEIGKSGLTKTFQRDFKKTTKCCKCGGESRVAFVAHEVDVAEKEPFVCSLHSNNGKGNYWLHDCCAVAIYICKECFEATALLNQG